MRVGIAIIALCIGIWTVVVPAEGGEPMTRGKLRVLVDKVMQPEEGWVTKEWIVREAAEAGFNVFSPRIGFDRHDEVRQVAEWCAKYGIGHLVWMRGSLAAPEGPEADGKRLVWASGNEQPLWSPNADELWDWMTGHILAYAKISVDVPSLIGVFLDYENYAPGRKDGNLYSLSYDDLILSQFAESEGIELPDLPLGQRRAWLEEQGLHDAFERFQVNAWRERCRELRRKVDAINPAFRFAVYPAPGTPFMVQAIYPEWATEAAPLILADASTYGRPSKTAFQLPALESNRELLLKRRQIPLEAGIPHLYIGGIDPVVHGADPEFSGKNAVMISETTDGYWIFYEGPKYTEDHPEYFKWFSWANRAIVEGRLDAWREPRETPEAWAEALQEALTAPDWKGETVELPNVHLRGQNIVVFAARKGKPVTFTLEELPLADYESQLVWEVRGPDTASAGSGTIPHGKTGIAQFTPKADGVYLLLLSAGRCAYAIRRVNVPIGLAARDRLSFINGPQRLYFTPKAGATEIGLRVAGSQDETVRATVFDPSGEALGSVQTTPEQNETRLRVPVEEKGEGVWSVLLSPADTGRFEDHSIRAEEGMPATFSLVPEHVFRTK